MEKWIEVDLDKLAHNYRLIRQWLPQEKKLLAVVKADAYGHGLTQVGKLYAHLGADYLGVTDIEEGRLLRAAGITVPILVFAPFLPQMLPELVTHDLTATLSNLEQLKALGEQMLPFKAHLKIETGLGRTGFDLVDLAEALAILSTMPHIAIEGVYTHLATAMWQNDKYVKAQWAIFEQGMQLLERAGYDGLIRHMANSAAMMKYPQYHLDMVRAGTILYGQEGGAYRQVLGDDLADGWALKAKVVALESLPKGHGVGYERIFVTKRPSVIAILPVGYSYGVGVEPILRTRKMGDVLKSIAKTLLRFVDHPRMRLVVSGNGLRLPVVGKIAMQLTMVDATDAPSLRVGDILTVPARRTTINGVLPKQYLGGQKMVEVEARGQEIAEI